MIYYFQVRLSCAIFDSEQFSMNAWQRCQYVTTLEMWRMLHAGILT